MFFIATLLIIIVFIAGFIYQKTGARIGGSIALSKHLWLFYTIYTWFFLLNFILLRVDINPVLGLYLKIFSVLFLVRAPVELFMLFVSKNWTPPLGIAHDLICFVVLLAGSIHCFVFSDLKLWESLLLLNLFLGITLETFYAYKFYKIVGDKTKGDQGIWFACHEDPKFQKVLKITTVFNMPIFVSLLWVMALLTQEGLLL